MGAREGRRKDLEKSSRERVPRIDHLCHKDAPLRRISLGRPETVWIGVWRIQDSMLERNHLYAKVSTILHVVDIIFTFWKRKFLAPFWYKVFTQFTAHTVVLATVAPGELPVRSAPAPTSLVPIQRVKMVSSMLRRSEPFFNSVKNRGSWLSNTDGNGLSVMLFEHVAPDRANGKSLKFPSCAVKTGQAVPLSPTLTYMWPHDTQ